MTTVVPRSGVAATAMKAPALAMNADASAATEGAIEPRSRFAAR
jgi:hypothetical protein